MHIAIALTALLILAKAFDEASEDAPHFGWSMASIAGFIVAGGMA